MKLYQCLCVELKKRAREAGFCSIREKKVPAKDEGGGDTILFLPSFFSIPPVCWPIVFPVGETALPSLFIVALY